jgi:uracil-DNA glycosylase family 4
MSRRSGLDEVRAEVITCRACPRLVEWRERVAREKRASFADEDYWGRPVPGFGDPTARLIVVGLAPAAHGGNRTGRVFTGDRSGDWLFGALYRAGYANQPNSVSVDDGLVLKGAYVTAAVKCAPPANKPTPEERDRCLPFLGREMALLDEARVVVCLGQFAYAVVAGLLGVRPRPKFGHGVELTVPRATGSRSRRRKDDPLTVICSYHPSQQNTFTGKLTEEMFDAVFRRARQLGA